MTTNKKVFEYFIKPLLFHETIFPKIVFSLFNIYYRLIRVKNRKNNIRPLK